MLQVACEPIDFFGHGAIVLDDFYHVFLTQPDDANVLRAEALHPCVEPTNLVHVRAEVSGQLDGGTNASDLLANVEVRKHDRHIGTSRDVVEARLPVIDMRASTLGRHHQDQ